MKFLKTVILFIGAIGMSFSFIQQPKNLFPTTVGNKIELSKKEQIYWEKAFDVFGKMSNNEVEYKSLSDDLKSLIDTIETSIENTVEHTEGAAIMPPCGFYCGSGPYKFTSSSTLKSSKKINYRAENAHDFNLLTAWVSDTKQGSIGQKINFHFKANTKNIRSIAVYNGYFKNKELWKKNARVKKFKLYVNGELHSILNLKNIPAAQRFKVTPNQPKDKDMVITFEIVEIYKGTTYDDVAISEINFDGYGH